MLMRTSLLLVTLFACAGTAAAQGIVIPVDEEIPPLALERHDVRVEIDKQTAVTTVEQVFLNNTERRLEAQYVFPVPRGAAMTRFTMLVNGRETQGELVGKEKARSLYNAIVRRSEDPGLLEYLGGDIYRASIFPIEPNGRQKITMSFTQVLNSENELVQFVYRVRAGAKRGPKVHGDLSITVSLKTDAPIQNIYSPSHDVFVEHAGEQEAKITYTAKNAVMRKNFQLYYTVGRDDVGLGLATVRPDPNEPGYFMMLLSPRSRLQATRLVARDLVFVVDTSGSMKGKKIKQAKNALKYCITNLHDGDRFSIVRFATDAYRWQDTLVSAAERRESALRWIGKIEAFGGTDISGALDAAISYPRDPARPFFVIFLTDGKPTIMEMKTEKLIAKMEQARAAEGGASLRMFTWGVGYDVDTTLLDGLADAAGGVSEYVQPEENIATKISSFYGKTSHPVLTHLALETAGVGVRLLDMHPKTLPDLYAGGQVVVFGRYEGSGEAAFTLTGRVNEKIDSFTYKAMFSERATGSDFIEALWARRRVGFLLDTIRRNGETKELVDEVVRLSMDAGIQTPYTSFLILEDGTAAPIARGRGGWAGAGEDRKKAKAELDKIVQRRDIPATRSEEKERREQNARLRSLAEGFGKKDGESAVHAARFLRRLKDARNAEDDPRIVPFKKAAGTRFFAFRGMWVDERFTAGSKVTVVQFGSAAYFKLIEKHPELVKALKVGTSIVVVTAKGKALAVTPSGQKTLSNEQIRDLFKPAK